MSTILLVFKLSPAYFYTVVCVFGLLIGSFLNVVALRIPKGMSVSHPPSHCTSCGHRLGPLDLIPVISYVLARGKCRYCGESFSIAYAVWEALAGIFFVLTAMVLGPVPELLVGLTLVSILIAIVQTDLRHLLIPNKIVFFGMGAGLLLRIFIHESPLWQYVVAFLIGGGVLYLIAFLGELLLKKESMGGGDIKLLAMLGLYIGVKGVLLTIFLGSLIGLVASLILMAAGLIKREQAVPFGPYLALGAYAAYLWGDQLLSWYMNLLV